MKFSINLRSLIMLTVLSSLSMTIMNCSKDTPSAQIVGSWKIVNIFVKQGMAADSDQLPALVNVLPCAKDIIFIFQKSGKVSYNTPEECKSVANNFSGSSEVSDYEVKDKELTITGKRVNSFDVTFSGKKMTWTLVDGSGTPIITTTRIILEEQ